MTDSTPLDLKAFEQLLDVHGADLARWPSELAPQAQALLERSEAARALLVRAQRVASLLDAVPDLLPSAELSARIAALPARHRQGWAVWWPFGNPLAPLLAWGAAAAFGLFVGSGLVPGLDPGSEAPAPAAPQEGTQADPAAPCALAESEDEPAFADELDGDGWEELELALGLSPDWEEDP